MSCSRETPVGTPRCMPARSSLLALVVRLSPSLFACRPRCSLVALAGRPSQFAPRRFSLAGRPSQFAPRSFPLAPQCPSRSSGPYGLRSYWRRTSRGVFKWRQVKLVKVEECLLFPSAYIAVLSRYNVAGYGLFFGNFPCLIEVWVLYSIYW